MMEPTGSITVRVKDGGLKCGDLDVQCNYADKVRQLKQMISAKSPLHPDVSDQRLIYSGHMLGDEQTLKDVFTANGEASQSSYTVHLAYRGGGRFNQPNPPSSQSSASTPSSSSSSSSAPSSSTPSSTKDQPPSSQSNPASSNARFHSFSVPYHPGQSDFGQLQTGIHPDLIALHEYYVRQMMTYMIQWSQFPLQGVHPVASFDPNFPPARAFIAPQRMPPEAPNVIPNDPHDNVRANDVAHRVDDDEAPRDVLDWMYTLVRVALIFSVVYFYSNFTRFFLVVLFTALVMVFQRRQQARLEEPQVAHQRQGAANNAPDQNQAPQGAEARPVDDNRAHSSANDEAGRAGAEDGSGGNHGDDGNGNAVAGAPPQEPRRSIRDITWTFLTTFFTSLIPDMPQNN